MKNQSFAIEYKDMFNGIISSEICRPCELKYFLRDGEIQILEIDQSFDGWETMEILYKAQR